MPAESKKQEMFMQAVANNPEFAKKVGVKQSIGQEFTKEKDMDKRTKSIMNEKDEIRRVDKEIRDNEGYKAGGMLARTGGSNAPMDAKGKKMNMGGLTADAAGARAMDPKMAMAMEARRRAAAGGGMKKGGAIKKMKEGGELKDGVKGITSRKAKKDQFNFQRGYRRGLINATRAFNVKGKIDTTENKLDKLNRGDNKLYQGEVKGKKDMDAALKGQGAYKKGGTVKSNAGRDGVATRGKTKGRMV